MGAPGPAAVMYLKVPPVTGAPVVEVGDVEVVAAGLVAVGLAVVVAGVVAAGVVVVGVVAAGVDVVGVVAGGVVEEVVLLQPVIMKMHASKTTSGTISLFTKILLTYPHIPLGNIPICIFYIIFSKSLCRGTVCRSRFYPVILSYLSAATRIAGDPLGCRIPWLVLAPYQLFPSPAKPGNHSLKMKKGLRVAESPFSP